MSLGGTLQEVGGSKKQRLIFIHTPKTAGTTISRTIRRHLAQKGEEKSAYLLHDHELVATSIEEANAASYVHGHFSWVNLQLITDRGDDFVFTFIRPPAERLCSLYFHMRRPTSHREIEDYRDFRDMSPREFLASDDPRILFFSDNFAVRQFSDRLGVDGTFYRDPELALSMATANLASLAYIGEAAHMNKDFQRIVTKAGIDWSNDVPHERKRNPSQFEDHEKVEEQFYAELAGRAYGLIEWDFKLYEMARELAEQKRRNF